MFKVMLCVKNKWKIARRCYSSICGVLNQHDVGNLIEIKGWVKSLRNQKEHIFMDVSDGSTHKKLQVLISKDLKPKNLTTGCSVVARGSLGVSPRGNIELTASHVEVCGECAVSEGYPFAPRKEYTPEYIRQHLHFRPRTNKFSSLLRIRNRATLAFYDYLDSEGFINVHTPILTSNDCEGAGEVFKVLPDNEQLIKSMAKPEDTPDQTYFGTKTFLTVSGQLHLEAAAHSLSKVYTFGPTFRAENSRSRLHLSEFYMLEAEVAFVTKIEELITIIEQMLKRVTRTVLDKSQDEFEIFSQGSVQDFTWLDKSFAVLTFDDAVEIINKNNDKFKDQFSEKDGFGKEHELFLANYVGNMPVFVINWPKSIKPFYMLECCDDNNKVSALDLIAPGVGEVLGGSLRENSYDKLQKKLPSGHNLQWYLDLRKFGSVPTAGFGLGFERYLQLLLGISNIKDTIPFPRWPHNCAL